jgi:PilZ domain
MQERRAAERLRIDLNARWEALRAEGRGAVCDLSSLGCFVLSSAEVRAGEVIRLDVNFPQETATLWGQVVYTVAEMGFAVRFGFALEADKDRLVRLIETLHQSSVAG